MTTRREPKLPGTQEEELAAIGAGILSRYRHPGNWIHGYTVSSALRECMVLAVSELCASPGSPTVHLAAMYREAVLAWAKQAGLNRTQLQLHRRPDGSVYVAVPKLYWKGVLPQLQQIGVFLG